MIEIVNKQSEVKIEIEEFVVFAEKAADSIDESRDKEISITFFNDIRIKELNNTFRNKNNPTDVLSFPYESDQFYFLGTENILGDIVISLETAQRQATENSISLETEIKQLILHGILHLCGYDHETDSGEMNELELKLREKLEI